MTKRKIIREQVDDVSTWEFEGKLSSVLGHVQEMIKKHGPDAYLSYNRNYYYDYDNNPTPRYEMYVDREETDAEVKQRLLHEAAYTRQREEADRAEFERLSKKFGEQK